MERDADSFKLIKKLMDTFYIVIYLILALVTFVTLLKGKNKWSLLLFVVFATKGMSVLPDEVGFIRASYITFAYSILFFLKNRQFMVQSFKTGIGQPLKRLFLFFGVSIFVSVAYFHLPPVSTIVVGSRYLILASALFFNILSYKDKVWLLRTIFYITVVLSLMFVIQSFTGVGFIQTATEDGLGLDAQGFYHGALLPPFTQMMIFVSFFDDKYLSKRLRVIGGVLCFLAVICTMYRTLLAVTFLTIIAIMFFGKFRTRNIIVACIVGVLIYTFQTQFATRASKDGKTIQDIEYLLEGKFNQADYQSQNGLTMLYRFALVKERLDYMVDKPIEMVFGLGMTVDNAWAVSQYHFRYGIPDEYGRPSQLRTPDIDWGNFFCNYGFLGTILFFCFYLKSLGTLKKIRKYSTLGNVLFVYSALLIITSVSGNVLSEPYSLVPLFVVYAVATDKELLPVKNKNKKKYDVIYNSYSVLQCGKLHRANH